MVVRATAGASLPHSLSAPYRRALRGAPSDKMSVDWLAWLAAGHRPRGIAARGPQVLEELFDFARQPFGG